jgi:hypothetical protein
MINWMKYDPENPPRGMVECLVTDGHDVDIALLIERETDVWSLPDCSPIDGSRAVTHYAHINLPGEETE